MFRCRFIGTTRLAPYVYFLPRSHHGFRETFDLLLDAMIYDLVVEVTVEEPDGSRRLTVASVSLSGEG